MTSMLIFILFISIHCFTGKCDEASIAKDTITKTPEKTELLTIDIISSENLSDETENVTELKTEEIEDAKQLELLSNSNRYLRNSTGFEDVTELLSTKSEFAEEYVSPEVIIKKKEDEKNDIDRRESGENENVTMKPRNTNAEEQLEQFTTTAYAVTEIQKKKALSDLEGNADMFSDHENTSLQTEEHDRNSNLEIEETDGDSNLKGFRGTRRNFGSPDLVLDTKARSGEAAVDISAEIKITPRPSTNNQDTLNEFGSENKNQLLDDDLKLYRNSRVRLMPEQVTTFIKTTTPVIKTVSNQEVLDKQTLSKLYSQSDLDINTPALDGNFQRITDLPAYLELKQDQAQSRNNLIESQNSQMYSKEKRKLYNQQQDHTSTAKVYWENKQLENLSHVQRNRSQQYLNQGLIDSRTLSENKQNEYLINEPRKLIYHFQHTQGILRPKGRTRNENVDIYNLNQTQKNLQQFYQTPVALNPKHVESLNQNPKNQIQQIINEEIMNSKRTLDNHQIENSSQGPISKMLLSQNQHLINSNTDFENKHLENINYKLKTFYKQFDNMNLESIASLDNYLQAPNIPGVNKLQMPASYYDSNSKNYNTLFFKLADATSSPRKLMRDSYRTKDNIEIYPHFFSPNNADSYDLSYISEYQNVL